MIFALSLGLVYDFTNKIEDKIQDLRRPLLVKYAAPWCVNCEKMSDNFETVSDMLGKQVRTAEVNCITKEQFCLS